MFHLSFSLPIFTFAWPLCGDASIHYHSSLPVHSHCICFSLCTPPSFFFCWIEEPQSGRRRPGIFLCPSSPVFSADSLSLPGLGSAKCGHGSGPRATTPPPPSFTHSDSALLRKSVSFTEDLLLAASGIVGLLCVKELLIEMGQQQLQVTI
ncbi:hypothetical protein AMECASPLE_034115 [Ameca splendens]|uniref:Uncharacterized protein n=1 Tax=Ameca splendens TaxID=208324 RepID=A0ABV0XJZ4_9TELE